MLREVYAKKIGMTQVFNESGDLVGVTVLDCEPVRLLEVVTYPKKKVARIGCFKWDEKKLNKISQPVHGYFKKLQTSAYQLIREVTLEKEATETAATSEVKEFGVEIFKEGEIVDVRAKTKGRGFAGGMKRHGWHGGPATHGHTSHRRTGSNGANTDPGRVVKGHRMPGHFGCEYRTSKNLVVARIDKEKNLLFIRGSVPGGKGSIVEVRKTK